MEQIPKRKKSRSKSIDLGKPRLESTKHNKTFDVHQDIKSLDASKESVPRPKSKKKFGKEKLSISMLDVSQKAVESISNGETKMKPNGAKSIIKSTTDHKDTLVEAWTPKPGKRNKSVSFMLDDEEIASKKTKSQPVADPVVKNKSKSSKNKNKFKDAEKENNINKSDVGSEVKNKRKKNKKNKGNNSENEINVSTYQPNGEKGRRSLKKSINSGSRDVSESGDKPSEAKRPKLKKKKNNSHENANDPPLKSQKKALIPEVVAENLENLNIGENPHTLTNLLDEMTVATKKKKARKPKNKKHTEKPDSHQKTENNSDEKPVFKKKKSIKDRRKIMFTYDLKTAVIVNDIPLEQILTYKKQFYEHFKVYGPLKHVGVAEMHSDNSKMTFSTIIYFHSEEAAEKAVSGGAVAAGGARLWVQAPPPREQATLVVRSYAELDEQNLSSAMLPSGRVRAIHVVPKGKKASCTAFVEFDSGAALDRALSTAEGLRLAGKKVHLSRFDYSRRPKRAPPAAPAPATPAGPAAAQPASDSEEESD